MSDKRLNGAAVLVTRPSGQAGELVQAIEAEGGTAVVFPVIDIAPLHPDAVAAAAHRLKPPDIALFVSRNAVRHGLPYAGSAAIGAIGPATARAIEKSGCEVTIRPETGFDSEHLLASPALADVAGQTVRIIRGTTGRELLGKTLAERGAHVEYLSVYERRLPQYDQAELDAVTAQLERGTIGAITVMSIESLRNLLALLPPRGLAALPKVPLVTPAERVIKECHERIPGSRPTLAAGPQASDMVRAIIALAASG
ncbi:MAG: uroporphyrinogen-III synthase [Woeseiaceae bacterium]|nr:uroporphyrinogen-III synthase [Woeseiaceae bacterium]